MSWDVKQIDKGMVREGSRRLIIDYFMAGETYQEEILVGPHTTDAWVEDQVKNRVAWLDARDEAFGKLTIGPVSIAAIDSKISQRPPPEPSPEPSPAAQFKAALQELRNAHEMAELGLVQADDPEIKKRFDNAAALFSWAFV